MSETDHSRLIREALEASGRWVVRVQSGKVKVRGGWMRLADAGTPDLCLVALSGWLEIKLPGESLSDDQVRWHEKARRNGVRVGVAESIMDAFRWAQQWELEDRRKAG